MKFLPRRMYVPMGPDRGGRTSSYDSASPTRRKYREERRGKKREGPAAQPPVDISPSPFNLPSQAKPPEENLPDIMSGRRSPDFPGSTGTPHRILPAHPRKTAFQAPPCSGMGRGRREKKELGFEERERSLPPAFQPVVHLESLYRRSRLFLLWPKGGNRRVKI